MKVSAFSTLATALLVSSAAASNSTTNGTVTAGCWDVSVEHDATYCIQGPICSGSGIEPTGSLCPVAGDVASADCHSYLTSYSGNDSCVLPVDTSCQVIETGAWGCVLSSSSKSASGSEAGEVQAGSGSAVDATVLVAETATSAGGISAGAVGVIAAAAAAVAAIAGFALYKQHQKHSAEAAERAHMETYVDVVTP